MAPAAPNNVLISVLGLATARPVEVELAAAIFEAELSRLESCVVECAISEIAVLKPLCDEVGGIVSPVDFTELPLFEGEENALVIAASVVMLPVTLDSTLTGLIVEGSDVDADAAPVEVSSVVFVRTTLVCPFANVVDATAPPANVKVLLSAMTLPPGPVRAWITNPVPYSPPRDAV